MKTCNLLPCKVQSQQLLAARLRQWLALSAAALALMLVWFTLAWQKRAVEQREADELIRQSQFVTYLSEQVDGLRKQNRALAYRETLFKKLQQQLRPLSVLGVVGQCAASCGGVTVDRLESGERAAPATGSAGDKDAPANLVSIHVQAASSLPVAQLVLALRERQSFRKVELKGNGDRQSGGQTSNSYLIECWF